MREPRTFFLQSNLERPRATLKASFSRSDLDDAAQKRASAIALQASSTRDQSLENDNRGLVIPPNSRHCADCADEKCSVRHERWIPCTGERKSGNRLAGATTAAEPSVHVTIGRIEVRATSESKPAGRAQTASPVMSLEEYLHRRTRQGDR